MKALLMTGAVAVGLAGVITLESLPRTSPYEVRLTDVLPQQESDACRLAITSDEDCAAMKLSVDRELCGKEVDAESEAIIDGSYDIWSSFAQRCITLGYDLGQGR